MLSCTRAARAVDGRRAARVIGCGGASGANARQCAPHTSTAVALSVWRQNARARDTLEAACVSPNVRRCGRDVELYQFLNRQREKHADEHLIEAREKKIKKVQEYCTKLKCRRVALLDYFGEKASANNICGRHGCDVCCDINDVRRRMAIRVANHANKRTATQRSSAVSTPAADFQSARSLLKQQQEKERAQERPKLGEAIEDFSEEEHDPEAKQALKSIELGSDDDIDFEALKKVEKAHERRLLGRLKRPRDRIMDKLGLQKEQASSAPKRRRNSQTKINFGKHRVPKSAP